MSEPADTLSLLGPRPEVPPTWLEVHGPVAAALLAVVIVTAWALARWLRRRRPAQADPAADFRTRLAAARAAEPTRQGMLAAAALRAYLAAISPAAPAALTTEELAGAIVGSPLLSTAADPILRALRAADRAKFAAPDAEADAAADLAELAFANLELARRALWKEASA